jgi:hypothetical protein
MMKLGCARLNGFNLANFSLTNLLARLGLGAFSGMVKRWHGFFLTGCPND